MARRVAGTAPRGRVLGERAAPPLLTAAVRGSTIVSPNSPIHERLGDAPAGRVSGPPYQGGAMRLCSRLACLVAIVWASVVFSACPPPPAPPPPSELPILSHSESHPVVLKVSEIREQVETEGEEPGAEMQAVEIQEEGAEREVSSSEDSCEISVHPDVASILCATERYPRQPPKLYGVEWIAVVPAGAGAPELGVEQVCIEPKGPQPALFADEGYCIDVGRYNAVGDEPDCGLVDPAASWQYKVLAKDGEGNVLCSTNPPEIYVDEDG